MQMNDIIYYLLCAIIVAAVMLLTLFVVYPFVDDACKRIKMRRKR